MPSRTLYSRRSVLILLTGVLLLFIITFSLWVINTFYTVIEEEAFEGFVFSKERSSELLGFMVSNDQSIGSYWTPSKNQILAIEDQLSSKVEEQILTLAPWLKRAKRKYLGFLRDGNKIVLIIGF